ncbi:hypothetical protein [Dyella humicola]|uniref:hypothetical protein n=1 Tax=Dyella humicola TaxID=2992126 RepID=UPI002254E745|nr:hypothetical protein [Dyella humicola]
MRQVIWGIWRVLALSLSLGPLAAVALAKDAGPVQWKPDIALWLSALKLVLAD